MNKKLCLFITIFLSPLAAYAQQQESNGTDKKLTAGNDNNLEQDDTIVVRSTPTSQTMGTQILTEEQIKKIPTRNGSVTELLKTNPNVQFANSADNSNTPGEISPENVSFHGEKFYQNNYMIDGLSNNNTINPGANGGELTSNPDGYSPTDLPAGGAQSFWINSELVEQLEVFDSNVSAKYGDFSGGVVDSKLKDPKLDRPSGKISYRTTRASWTSYHVDENISEDYDTATNLYYQPKFTKNFYSVTVNQPLSDKAGFIFAYNRQESTIPYYHAYLDQWTDQKRIAETYLLKGTYLADNGDIFRLISMYAPHESKYYKKNVKDGAFTNTGGGYRFNMEWEHIADWGDVNTLLGYQYERNKIDHESNSFKNWIYHSASNNFTSEALDWQTTDNTSQIGGYGTFSTKKTTTTLKQDYAMNPIHFYGLNHQFDLGWQVDFYSAEYRRYSDVYTGTATRNTSVMCQSGDKWCIDGEQYMKNRTVYPSRTVEGNYTNYAVYLQDSMTFGQLEVTPGMRLSYDDYLGNLNVAPRFGTSYDVFGDRRTRLFGGANRYYAQNMLAYKLRQGISSYYTQTRSSASSDWTNSSLKTATYDYDVSDLKTPFSDELSLGLSQRVWDTVWTAKWVHRKGRDQFGRTNYTDDSGKKYYVLNNDASTQGNTVSLTVEPISPYHFAWADIGWSLGASISDNKSSSQAYYDLSNTDSDKVIFDGKLMEKGDMDALNYNTPWRVFLNVDTQFPYIRLTWDQMLAYTSGYKSYTTSTVACPDGNSACGDYDGNATLYKEKQFKDYISYDWRFSYSQPIYKEQTLDITLDVLNVFDNIIETSSSGTLSSSTITYKTGRQFWLGIAYNW